MAPFNWTAVQYPIYQPAMRLVIALTNAQQAAVTTSFDHNFQTGDIVRLWVPFGWGMVQVNERIGTITVTSPTTFTIDIDTTSFDIFTVPTIPIPAINQPAMVTPVGEVASKLTQAKRNILGGL